MRTFAQKPKATQHIEPPKSKKPGRTVSGQSRNVRSILHLQRTIGNQAVQRLLQSETENVEASSASNKLTGFAHDFSRIPVYGSGHSSIQPKLKVNTPGDKYEQEADRVAEQVMRMPEPAVQRQVEPEEEEQEVLQAKPLADQITPLVQRQVAPGQTHEVTPTLANHINALRGGGQPLDPGTRAFMQSRFGHDFSRVRIHTDAKATVSAQAINAAAFTVGRDIVFAAGQYAPQTSEGQRLLAHELTHFVQQGGKSFDGRSDLVLGAVDNIYEEQADGRADAVLAGSNLTSAVPNTSATDFVVQRQKGEGPWSPDHIMIIVRSDNIKTCQGVVNRKDKTLLSSCGPAKDCTLPATFMFDIWFVVDNTLDDARPKPFKPPTVAMDASFTPDKGEKSTWRGWDTKPIYQGGGLPLKTNFGSKITFETVPDGIFHVVLTLYDKDTKIRLAYVDRIKCRQVPLVECQ